jgi:hypothetical protein
MRLVLAAALVASAPSCGPPDYVADVQAGPHGTLILTKCAAGQHGWIRACRDEVQEPQPFLAPDAIAEDRRNIDAYEASLDRRPARPAPTAAGVAHAMSASGVSKLLARCRAAFAPSLGSLQLTIAIDPSGAITAVEAGDVDARFTDCAMRAVSATSIAPFDGPPVRVDERLTF